MMLIALFLSQVAFATNVNPTPFPVFLKEGFSSVLEFDEAPVQIVLGDSTQFQVERLNRSVAIKALSPYATTNMFVYFKNKETRLFILTVSEDALPTYYKRFSSAAIPAPKTKTPAPSIRYDRSVKITGVSFDKKRDFLTIDLELSANADGKMSPNWDLVRLKHKDRFLMPRKLWSERQDIQRDSRIKARLIFAKPNVSERFNDVSLIVPIKGSTNSFTLSLESVRR